MKKDIFNEDQENFIVSSPKQFVVVPNLPESLQPLQEIANNMWWCWNSDAVELFRRLDREVWEETYHNPKAMLASISQKRFEELSGDDSFISNMQRVKIELDKYMGMKTWFHETYPDNLNAKFAYFSTEFAIHESVPIYSGGLGVLSGDHLKSASDLGLPLVGVGLLYRFGYFKQYLDAEGWQKEEYNENRFSNLPLQKVNNEDGTPLVVDVDIQRHKVYARVWKLQVGRVPLYLLDTDIAQNPQPYRGITNELYGGDRDMRIRQEIILGIGGVKLLKALNIDPGVIHINEGHSAFLLFEKMREYVEDKKLSAQEAFQMVKKSCVFTTHTPVPAGNEVFSSELVVSYLEDLYRKIGISKDEFLRFGSFPTNALPSNFSMTILALRLTNKANGVSRLHASVARKMWSDLYPQLPKKEVPITHITNGIHTNTWLSYEFATLFDRYLGEAWKDEPSDHSIWNRVEFIPDTELWRSHERRRERLVSFARARLKHQYERLGASEKTINDVDEILDPEALTIGFSRRFASYKRGNLIFRDLDRITEILTNKERPVQIIIAGKAHPQDNIGKKIIKEIVDLSNDPELRNRIVFLEDYDMNVAHYLIQGADIWLNNPLRPEEASGTSGMKAAANGVLNFSVLDGWWCEGYNHENGWMIGTTDEYADREYQDDLESQAIYEILEKEIVPLYYTRGAGAIPTGWVKKMKEAMQSLGPVFNTNRMLEEYTNKFYMPTVIESTKLKENNFQDIKDYTAWYENTSKNWNNIKIITSSDNVDSEIKTRNMLEVSARVELVNVSSDDISVQIYSGYIDSKHEISSANIDEMKSVSREGNVCVFEGKTVIDKVGHCAYTIRILPKFKGKVQYIPNLVKWHHNIK